MPFAIEEPGFIPDGLTKANTNLTIESNILGKIYALITYYRGTGYRSMTIMQVNDTGKPEELLDKCEKINLNNWDAWIYDPCNDENGNIQLMFW